MSVKTTPDMARLLTIVSEMDIDGIKEWTVASLLAWKANHPEADVISDVFMDVVSAMVIDAGGQVIMREMDEDEWNDEFGDDWDDED